MSSPSKLTVNKPIQTVETASQASALIKRRSSTDFPIFLTGAVIARWRHSLNENLTEFAARLGVSSSSLSLWESKGMKKLQPSEKSLNILRQAWKKCYDPVEKEERLPFPNPLNGYAVSRWRESLNETQAEFARRLGVSASCVCQWELKKLRKVQPREEALESMRRLWEDYGLKADNSKKR